jgi:hypothetical protein
MEEQGVIEFRLMDDDIFSDDFIGEARLDLGSVHGNGGKWAGDLQLFRKKGRSAGWLNLGVVALDEQQAQLQQQAMFQTTHVPRQTVYPTQPQVYSTQQPTVFVQQSLPITTMGYGYQGPQEIIIDNGREEVIIERGLFGNEQITVIEDYPRHHHHHRHHYNDNYFYNGSMMDPMCMNGMNGMNMGGFNNNGFGMMGMNMGGFNNCGFGMDRGVPFGW